MEEEKLVKYGSNDKIIDWRFHRKERESSSMFASFANIIKKSIKILKSIKI